MTCKHLILLTLIALLPSLLPAQCGAEIEDQQLDALFEQGPDMRNFDATRTRGIRDYPVKAHVTRKSDHTGGMTREDVVTAIEELNDYYINANIRFVLLDQVEYIDSDRFYNFNSKDEAILAQIHDIKHVINIYFFNEVHKFGGNVCGYAQYPTASSETYNNDRIMVRNDCVRNGVSLAHEMGHYFSLLHTHGNPWSSNKPGELVRRDSRGNCTDAGDGLCDTAADPMLFGKVDYDCNYTKEEYDAHGHRYQPDPRNIMAYSVLGCRDQFTAGQYARINWGALKYRYYLKFPDNVQIPEDDEPVHSQPVVFESPAAPTSNMSAVRLSGEVELKIGDQKIPTTLDGNLYACDESYYSGTNYRLVLANDQPAYVYVFSSDLGRQTELLFPLDYQSSRLSEAFQRYALPSTSHLYTLDENKGKDYLCVLYSRKPLSIRMILYNIENERGTFMQRLYRVLGNELVPSNYVEYKEDGRLRFGANAMHGSVVPIVVEIDHL